MNESDIIKLIKSNSQAIKENLLLSDELSKIKDILESFLDKKLTNKDLLSLRYRKFKSTNKSRTLYSDTNGYATESEYWIGPYIKFFENYITEKKIINKLEDESLWVESRTQGNEQHILIGEKKNKGEKAHLILGETGEIRIDKKDQNPSELLKKVEAVLTKPNGEIVKSTLEFFNEKI